MLGGDFYMAGKHQYHVLSNAYHKDHLIGQGEKNGIHWEKNDHEGVNWMRFSHALCQHLEGGNVFPIDDADPEILQDMLKQYIQLRDLHKRTMIPHIRSAMSKLHSDRNDANLRPIDLLKEAHEHLSANGGHEWAEKVSTLTHLNSHISKLHKRLNDLGRMPE